MSFDRQWAQGGQMLPPQPQMQAQRTVTVDVHEFIRTRDALTSAYINLSSSFQNAVKAYLDHTQVVLEGDATLNVGHMLTAFAPLGAMANPAQMAAMALQQNGGPVHAELKAEPDEKKRKKRSYKPRDPNAPKRPLTAYFRYLGDVRGSISDELQKNPDRYKEIAGQPGDISRIATQRWGQMTDEEKEPYKLAYQEELKEYTVKADEYTKAKGLAADALGEGDLTAITEADPDAPTASPVVLGAVAKGDNPVEDDDESSDSSSSSSDSDDDDEPAPPPKPTTPKKSALKKNKAAATASAPQQTFSSIPTPAFSSINQDRAAASSPTRKRKNDAVEAEGSKKRGRKATVNVGSDPTPVASSPEASEKKDKKKRKGRGDA